MPPEHGKAESEESRVSRARAALWESLKNDKGEFQALGREMVKDVRQTIHSFFFGHYEHASELGTPLNPTQKIITDQLTGQEPRQTRSDHHDFAISAEAKAPEKMSLEQFQRDAEAAKSQLQNRSQEHVQARSRDQER